jgi:GntR family transcriptional regulator/MocR family aminotransferase
VPPAKLARGALFYTTPSRQFPTGATLPVARRLALLKAAEESSAWILEDDYDSEFRYSRAPLPSLHSLDTAGRVIYLGTMSKVLYPALRIGYLALPPSLVEPFADLRATAEDHGPFIDQATLAEFLACGVFYSHIRRCRRAYAERLETFLDSARPLPFRFPHTDGGMNLMGLWTAAPRSSDDALQARLDEAGFDVAATSRYAIGPSRRGLLFGFTAFEPAVIRAGCRRLAALLDR